MTEEQMTGNEALAAVARIRAEHREGISRGGYGYCAVDGNAYPCDVICTLEGWDRGEKLQRGKP